MDYEKLRTEAAAVTMSEEAKHRIAGNCKSKLLTTERNMTMRSTPLFKRPAAVITILVLCLSLSVTALAATGTLQGFFRDISDFRGAVVGTSYEQATDEIRVSVSISGEELTVLADFVDPTMFPYREAETLGIAAYRILDENGNVVAQGASAEAAPVTEGQAVIPLYPENLESGSYTLEISAFSSEKKADQPLTISGNWECAFNR